MYRFDDKWRKRLLEDALVADLLDGSRSPSASAHTADDADNGSTSTVAGAPANHIRASKAAG
jgi:hypothetical protein